MKDVANKYGKFSYSKLVADTEQSTCGSDLVARCGNLTDCGFQVVADYCSMELEVNDNDVYTGFSKRQYSTRTIILKFGLRSQHTLKTMYHAECTEHSISNFVQTSKLGEKYFAEVLGLSLKNHPL